MLRFHRQCIFRNMFSAEEMTKITKVCESKAITKHQYGVGVDNCIFKITCMPSDDCVFIFDGQTLPVYKEIIMFKQNEICEICVQSQMKKEFFFVTFTLKNCIIIRRNDKKSMTFRQKLTNNFIAEGQFNSWINVKNDKINWFNKCVINLCL